MHGCFIVLSLAKKNIDVYVEKGASYYKQYYNQQQEKSRDISCGKLLMEASVLLVTWETQTPIPHREAVVTNISVEYRYGKIECFVCGPTAAVTK